MLSAVLLLNFVYKTLLKSFSSAIIDFQRGFVRTPRTPPPPPPTRLNDFRKSAEKIHKSIPVSPALNRSCKNLRNLFPYLVSCKCIKNFQGPL